MIQGTKLFKKLSLKIGNSNDGLYYEIMTQTAYIHHDYDDDGTPTSYIL